MTLTGNGGANTLAGEAAQRENTTSHIKATKKDWLNVARDLLISEGVASVKVLTIGQMLGVSRSSFYWYFTSRKDLLNQLLADWENTNTRIIVRHAELPAASIIEAVCNFFRCFIDERLFDPRLDFAVREWARRDGAVRRVVDRGDTKRLEALTAMFVRHGYEVNEAEIRARILYFMQIGYHALELAESLEERLARIEGYLLGFTGKKANPGELDAILESMARLGRSEP